MAIRVFNGSFSFVDATDVRVDSGIVLTAQQASTRTAWFVEVKCVGLITRKFSLFVEHRSDPDKLKKAIEEAVFEQLFTFRAQHPYKRGKLARGNWT